MPAPRETIRTSAAQCRGGFRKKVFGPPFLQGRKGGVRTCVRVEKPISENRVASCIPPFRTFPGVRYGRARHRLFRNRRYGRMHVHRTQRKRCSRKGVCSGPSAWRPASVEAPVAGVDKVAQPENSGFPLRMWLRSWLRHAKVARVVVMGLRRLARAVCEGVRARWRDGAGSLLTLGIRSCRCLHTHWRGQSMTQTFDHRETAAGVWQLPRTLCESVGER
jgi:hypothetical protein